MKSIQFTMLAVILLLPIHSYAGSAEIIDTEAKEKADYYPWITFLSKGPALWHTEDEASKVRGRAYRIVVLNDKTDTNVFIEETISGAEGCCVSIASIRELDLDQLYEKFGILGAISSFHFIAWRSATAFEFSIHERRFLLKGLDDKRIVVREL